MREQLAALEELSQIDLALRQADLELTEVTQHLEELRSDVARIKDLLERERQQLSEAEKMRLNHQAELEAIADKTARSKKRFDVARNQRESEATQRELEVLKREKEERTEEAARLETVITQVRESITRHTEDFTKLADLLTGEENSSRHKIEELQGKKRSAEVLRKESMGKLRQDVLRIYHMVAGKRGSAVAECQGGVCRACNMTLPPQLYNQLHTGSKIYQCPSCQRILVLRSATPR